MDAMPAHSLLPTLHITLHPTLMQVHPDMLGICKASQNKVRTYKGTISGYMANTEMQSMGRKRV